MKSKTRTVGFLKGVLICAAGAVPFQASAIINLGNAANYAVLYEGGGVNKHLNLNNGAGLAGLAANGNIGIDGTGHAQLSGPLTLNGNIDFANASSVSGIGGNVVLNGSVNANVPNLHATFTALNTLSSVLGAEVGTALNIAIGNGNTTTISAANGVLDAYGNRVFTVNQFSFGNGGTLKIDGNLAGHSVVFNFSDNASFGGKIVLDGGLSSDDVLFNFVGGGALTGGPDLTINNNGETLTGIFLDPNGKIQMNHSVLNGRLFGGGSDDMSIVSGAEVIQPMSAVPEAGTMLAGAMMVLLPLAAGGVRTLREKRKAA